MATRPPEGAWKRLSASLEDVHYPLTPYIELAALRQHIVRLEQGEVERFLTRWPDSLAASDLREAYLRELARRRDWTGFRALWKGSSARDLQCDELQARLAAGTRLDFSHDLAALWQGSQALPPACEPVLRAARQSHALDDAQVWNRLDRAAAAGSAGATAQAAALLDGAERSAAERIAAAVRDPATALAQASTWADAPRTRDAVAYGLARYARRNSAAAETAWAALETRFQWDAGAEESRAQRACVVPLDQLLARRDGAPEGAAGRRRRRCDARMARAHRARRRRFQGDPGRARPPLRTAENATSAGATCARAC